MEEILADTEEEKIGENLRKLTIVRCDKCRRVNMSVNYWFNACKCTGNPMYSCKMFMQEGEWVA